ncbi:GSCOCG00012227001-RA-CDS [Cotesia congregata]|nr:GSCOCG00010857001-RA-CDS [Cotesia congregata]CAD6232718.1 GSCOCG00012227001-RA-CDS [Cotesia congregata]
MFVKNIAMAVYGAQYLKEHSVKGKACNKTKSKPRPAIDNKKALAIKEIYEYYLKENKRFTEEEAAEEANNYEDYIRGKICDLRRPRTSSKNKKKDNETQSSSRGSGNGSDSGGGGSGSGSDSGGDSDSGSGNGSCSDDSEEEPSNQKKDNTTPSV